jgi:hypothetical protein
MSQSERSTSAISLARREALTGAVTLPGTVASATVRSPPRRSIGSDASIARGAGSSRKRIGAPHPGQKETASATSRRQRGQSTRRG